MAVSQTQAQRTGPSERQPRRKRLRRMVGIAVAAASLAVSASVLGPIKALAFTPPTTAQVQAAIAAAIAYLRPLQQGLPGFS